MAHRDKSRLHTRENVSAAASLQNGEFMPNFVPKSSRARRWARALTLQNESHEIIIQTSMENQSKYSLELLPFAHFGNGEHQQHRTEQQHNDRPHHADAVEQLRQANQLAAERQQLDGQQGGGAAQPFGVGGGIFAPHGAVAMDETDGDANCAWGNGRNEKNLEHAGWFCVAI